MSAENFIKNAEKSAENNSSGTVAADIVGELKKTQKSCNELREDQKQLALGQEQLKFKVENVAHTLWELNRTLGKIKQSADNLKAEEEKAVLEAQRASKAMSEVKASAKATKESFSDMPSRAELDKTIDGYVDEVFGKLHAEDQRIEELNHNVWIDRMKLTLEWGGIITFFVLIVLILIFFVPKGLKLVLGFMDMHTWALAIFWVVVILSILFAAFCIGSYLEEKSKWK